MQISFSAQPLEFNPVKTQAIEKMRFAEKPEEISRESENAISDNESVRNDDLKKLQDSLAEHDITLKFRQDDETGQLIVELVNDKTGEAIRQIPSEVSLKLSKMSVKIQGHFVDEKV